MTLRQALAGLARVVADEAARNSHFRSEVEQALGLAGSADVSPKKHVEADGPEWEVDGAREGGTAEATSPPGAPLKPEAPGGERRRGGRRSPALLDPVALAGQGDAVLRGRLGELDLDRLHDVVAEYGMDPGKLVMKWRDRERVIDRIVEVASARATKGDAFRRE